MDAVVTAGGRISGEFADRTGVTIKALLRIGSRPVIQTVVESLRDLADIDKVIVVGPEELKDAPIADVVDEIVPESPDGAANFLMGLKRCAGEKAVFAASDLPFLTPESVRGFLDQCPEGADFCYPILRKDRFRAVYPSESATFAPLRGGSYTGGCVFLLSPLPILANQSTIQRVFDSRKSIPRLAAVLGWSFCLRLLTRSADPDACARRGSEVIGCKCRVVDNCPPELTFDIDDLSDYEYAIRHAEARNA